MTPTLLATPQTDTNEHHSQFALYLHSLDLTRYKADLGAALVSAPTPPSLDPMNILARGELAQPGVPSLANIPISEQLTTGHPLERYIRQNDPLSSQQIKEILKPTESANDDGFRVNVSVVGFHAGTVTAAVREHLENPSRSESKHDEETDYANNSWLRDSVITATALHRSGFHEQAHRIIKNAWSFLGREENRHLITQYHFGDRERRRELWTTEGCTPSIKFSVGEDGALLPLNHRWGHQQLDALASLVWATFRFANRPGIDGGSSFNLSDLDPVPWATDSIVPATIKMLLGAEVYDQMDFGPWEDIWVSRRASSVGIVVAAMAEAREFFEREGWNALPVEYNGAQDGDEFKEQFSLLEHRCRSSLNERIPESGTATECDRRPHDSALTLLLYPFDAGLSQAQQETVLRTVYKNMGEAGFRRWAWDHAIGADGYEVGPDGYVGQDYHTNPNPEAKGEFAETAVEGYKAAEWSLFDPLLAAHFYKEYIRSGGAAFGLLLRADLHLKRTLSFITRTKESLYVAGKDETFTIPEGVLAEAFVWDSGQAKWLANHNSPLLMAQAGLALALERGLEANTLREGLEAHTSATPFFNQRLWSEELSVPSRV